MIFLTTLSLIYRFSKNQYIISIIITQASMKNSITGFFLSLLLAIQVNPIQINNILTINTVHFNNISEAFISLASQNLYVLNKNANTGYAQVIQYTISNGSYSYTQSLTSQNNYSQYWQLLDFDTEIMSFPIKHNQQADFLSFLTAQTTSITQKYILFRGIWVKSLSLAFFSTVTGEVGFANAYQVKNGEITLMPNCHHIGNTYLSLSPDERYICSTDIITGLVSIWETTTKILLKEVWLNQNGILTHTWSYDSALLFLFGRQSGIIYQLDANHDFAIIDNISTSMPYIFASFYYYETGDIIAIAYNQSQFLLIDFNQNTITNFSLNFAPRKLRFDYSKRFFTVFNEIQLSIFQIVSFCNGSQSYVPSQKICIDCQVGCKSCDGFTCYSCQINYHFNSAKNACIQDTAQPNQAIQSISQVAADIAKTTFTVLNTTITVPGHRQFLNTLFQLFSNFDHFLLYIYHNRSYGPNMQMILKQIHDTIDYRFQIINNDVCKEYLGLNFASIQSSIDYKANYTMQAYFNIQEKGQGFFESNIQYFLLNIPFIMLTLFGYRLIYYILSTSQLSIFFKKFTFWGILILLFLQGNIEFFFFSFTGDFLSFFTNHFEHKLLNIATLLAAGIFLFMSTYGLISLYLNYRSRSDELYDNCIGNCSAALYYLAVNGILNILRGIIHRVAINIPQTQAFSLFFLQTTQILIMICFWKRKIFKSKYIFILFISGSLSRAIFDLTLMISSLVQPQLLDYIHVVIFLFNVLTFLLSIIQSMYEVMIKLKQICSKKVKNSSMGLKLQGQQINNVLNVQYYDESKTYSQKRQQTSAGTTQKYKFKELKSHKMITFKICKKNILNALNINEYQKQILEKSAPKSQLQSINIE